MSYIDNTLGHRERVIHRARFHWSYMCTAYLWTAILALAGWFLGWIARPYLGPLPESFPTLMGVEPLVPYIAVGLGILLGLIVFTPMAIHRYSTERALTSLRVVQKFGLISRKTESIAIPKVEEVNLEQSIMGRILGYGTVRVSGTGGNEFTLKDIDNPVGFIKALNDARTGSESRQ